MNSLPSPPAAPPGQAPAQPERPACRVAGPGDARNILALHRAAFQRGVHRYSIYRHGHGVATYLAELLGGSPPNHVFYVAEDGGRCVGYGHFLRGDGFSHLNYVAVDGRRRGLGIASRLFGLWEADAALTPGASLRLDVSTWDHLALAWYRRRGFSQVSETRVYRLRKRRGPVPPYRVLDAQEADRRHAAFGFSQLQVQLEGHTWTVGRVSDRYFRITDPPSGDLVASLQHLDPHRNIIFLGETALPEGWGRLEDVLLRLERTQGDQADAGHRT